jgi:hypothetical protein
MKVRNADGSEALYVPEADALVQPGEVVEVDDKLGKRMVAGGVFEEVKSSKKESE